MSLNPFQRRKLEIISQLSVSDDQYRDLSPKGSLDDGIVELVGHINKIDPFITTSSCSGRVSVFVEGSKKSIVDVAEALDSNRIVVRPGGKGGGRWLFVSHDPIEIPSNTAHDSRHFHTLFGLKTMLQDPALDHAQRDRFVHFKFEPMVRRRR
jgi:tRNA wybutosine-synthesizing protein 3